MANEGSIVESSTVWSMEPRNLEEAMKYADLLSKSALVPKSYQGRPGDIIVAIQMGREVGLKPLQALQNISCVNGRPCVYGDAPLALVRNSKKLEDFREDFDPKTMTATCSVKRFGQPTPIIRVFSMEDAKRAGLSDKENYKKYGRRMIQLRARAFALRDGFSDVLQGLSIGEEVEEIIDVEAQALPAPAPPVATPAALPDSRPEPTDWRDLTTKRDGQCATCGIGIAAGTRVLYSATARAIKCTECPKATEADAEAESSATNGADEPTFE